MAELPLHHEWIGSLRNHERYAGVPQRMHWLLKKSTSPTQLRRWGQVIG